MTKFSSLLFAVVISILLTGYFAFVLCGIVFVLLLILYQIKPEWFKPF